MNITAEYSHKKVTAKGEVELVFKIPYTKDKEIAKKLEPGQNYRLGITKIKDKRTLEQNALMWALIHEIAQEVNTERATAQDEWEIYQRILENANVRYDVITTTEDVAPTLWQFYRVVAPVAKETTPDGKTLWTYKCYAGSSNYDITEMAKLLDLTMDMAAILGIELEERE